ncbi:MAG TPA: hypothetical protein VN493_21185 [Thermoanaerobaculia bacterium]|nr:hypothetical protein [Thermoanaerobaculia bacterium]
MLAISVLVLAASLEANPLYGPRELVRETGKPQEITERFEVSVTAPHYRLQVVNGLPDGSGRTSSSWVWLNGSQVFGPSDFNQGVGRLQRFVDLLPSNEIRARLTGKPGGRLTLEAMAMVGAGGGTVATSGGTRLRVPPGAVEDYVDVSVEEKAIEELPLSLPPGYTFLGAVAVDIGSAVLSSEADLEIPAPDSVEGPVIVARIVSLEDTWHLALVDTASLTPEGGLKTDSPPFPGVRASGDYVFLAMPEDVGIVGTHILDLNGDPVEGASFVVLMSSPGTEGFQPAVGGLGGFVGQADATGFAAVPGVPSNSDVVAVAIDPGRSGPGSGPAQAGLVQFSVGNVLANGLLGNWLQNLIVHHVFNLDDIPDVPRPCPCSALSPFPHEIPDPGGVFLPGETRDLEVLCGGTRVTTSTDLPDAALQILTTGLEVVVTKYVPKDPDIVSVSQGLDKAIVTAKERGTTLIAIGTEIYSLYKLGNVLQVQACGANGSVNPVVVDCPPGKIWDPVLQVCRRLRLSVQRVGSMADDGIVTSVPAGIQCGSDCQDEFDHGGTVLLQAGVLNPDAAFIEWGGDCAPCGTVSDCPILMQADTSCTAKFECAAAPTGTAILTASRDAGSSSMPVPRCGNTIRIRITVPNNMISGSGTTGNCGRGDVRVAVRVCPPNAGCTGFTVHAGQGQGLDICHAFDQFLGPFEIPNPRQPGSHLSFEAVTEKLSTATIELVKK